MLVNAFAGLSIIGIGFLALLFDIVCGMARGSPESHCYSTGNPMAPPSRMPGPGIIMTGLRRMFAGRRAEDRDE